MATLHIFPFLPVDTFYNAYGPTCLVDSVDYEILRADPVEQVFELFNSQSAKKSRRIQSRARNKTDFCGRLRPTDVRS